MTFYLRDAMTVEDFLASACLKKGLNPVEHFVRVKKRRDMQSLKYFVPHRSDLIETYVSITNVLHFIIMNFVDCFLNKKTPRTTIFWR